MSTAIADPTPDVLAARLLRRHLTPWQWRDWRANCAFNVRGASGNRYRIHGVWSENVNVTHTNDEELRYAWLCICMRLPGVGIVERGSLGAPIEDHVLAQMLLLTSDETGFLSIAQ